MMFGSHDLGEVSIIASIAVKYCDNEGGRAPKRESSNEASSDRGLANSYDRTMMSARLLRLQTSEEAQAGFGAEQLKVVLNAFFKASQLFSSVGLTSRPMDM